MLLLSFSFIAAQAQGKDKQGLIQFSGIIVEGDSMLGVPGVHVFSGKNGRGTSTNLLGYFSLPAKPGDSLIIAAIGFRKEIYTVPNDSLANYSVIIRLSEDTTMLPVIEIRPFPSERVFKQAFLAMHIPIEKEQSNMNKNLNDQILERMLYTLEDDGSMNHAYYMNKQIQYMEQRYMYQSGYVSIFDPFAWKRFFDDVESEKEKKLLKEKEENNTEGY